MRHALAFPSLGNLKMLDLAVRMATGVSGASQNNLQTDVILHSDSSSIGFAFRGCHLLAISLCREYSAQLVGCYSGRE
jgi:hypothetical protein